MSPQGSSSDPVSAFGSSRPRAGAGLRCLPTRDATLVGWKPPSGHMEHPEWVAVGHRLGRISRCNQWWLGDWLRYGSAKWGERYVEAARITGYDVRSLANMASIAASFDISRRRDSLTWSHHAVVAALDPEEQERWLDRAIAERLSVADLRIELRSTERSTAKAADRKLAPPVEETADITCPQCGYKLAQGALAATTPNG
jgi:hypothetical protein